MIWFLNFKIILLSEFSTFSFMNIFTISLFSNWSSKGWSLMDVSFFFTEWSYLGSFCEKFDNLGWKKLLMAFCLGILCKNVHLFNVFSLILFIQIVSILRAQSSIINNTEESNPINTRVKTAELIAWNLNRPRWIYDVWILRFYNT